MAIENDSNTRKQNKILFLINLDSLSTNKYFKCKRCECYLNRVYHSILIHSLLPTVFVSNPLEAGCVFCSNTMNDINKSLQILRIQQYREYTSDKKNHSSFTHCLGIIDMLFPDEIYIKKIDNIPIENYKHDPLNVDRPLLLQIYNEDDIIIYRIWIHNTLSNKEFSDHGL